VTKRVIQNRLKNMLQRCYRTKATDFGADSFDRVCVIFLGRYVIALCDTFLLVNLLHYQATTCTPTLLISHFMAVEKNALPIELAVDCTDHASCYLDFL
jgi:hypothetical protein